MSLTTVLWLCVCLAGITVVQGDMECKDIFSSCSVYGKGYCDDNSPYKAFMEKNCASYCGFCDCHNWKYGCCKDEKSHAEGPNEKGCATKLCYDMYPEYCIEIKNNGTCGKELVKDECPWSCGFCKSPAPIKSCHNMGFGCCWDGTSALGPNNRGCRPCRDMYKHACKQFQIKPYCSNTGAYHRRSFLETYCPDTCGYCPKCRDADSRCLTFLNKGYCDDLMWRPYMASSCAKTCGFCKGENGNLP